MKKLTQKALAIRNIINAWDPEDLLTLGMPEDEYESEVDYLMTDIISSRQSVEIIAEKLCRVFNEFFGSRRHRDDNSNDKRSFKRILEVAKKIQIALKGLRK
jgi:hypothetical protein